MNAETKIEKPEGLELLRMPFADHQISKLPKPTKRQAEIVREDFKKGIRCEICGGWHHPDVIHLDYVGHAALTDRLLDCDPNWNWEPLSADERGLPAFDQNGGLWIRLIVCGHSRIGYGDADGKKGGNAIKEAIGDALRNAAMRFGAALDLWHKGDLHLEDEPQPKQSYEFPDGPHDGITKLKAAVRGLWREAAGCGDEGELLGLLEAQENKATMQQCEGLQDPAHREIWEGDGKDNPGLKGFLDKRKDELRPMNNLQAG